MPRVISRNFATGDRVDSDAAVAIGSRAVPEHRGPAGPVALLVAAQRAIARVPVVLEDDRVALVDVLGLARRQGVAALGERAADVAVGVRGPIVGAGAR